MSGILAAFFCGSLPISRETLDNFLSISARTLLVSHSPRCWIRRASKTGAELFSSDPQFKGIHVAGDFRIDNRDELIQHLTQRNEELQRNVSDESLIAACYGAWGTVAFEKLEGEFSLVVWDDTRQRLYCARDPLGMRSVFYFHDSRQLLIASSIQAALDSDPRLVLTRSENAVAAYLAGRPLSPAGTFFQAIRRLPAGHYLETNDGGEIRIVRFWDPTRIPLVHHQRQADYADDFRQRFLNAVRNRLHSKTRRIGIHVSGGFDSSAIVTAAHYWNQQLHVPSHTTAFVNIGTHPDADERSYMDEVFARFPLEQSTTRSEDFWAFRVPRSEPRRRDEPFLAPYFARYIEELEVARELGIDVILSGAGGDEIGGSSMYLVDMFLRGRWFSFWPELSRRAAGKHASSPALLVSVLRQCARWFLGNVIHRQRRPPPWLHSRLAEKLVGLPQTHSRLDLRGPAREHLFRTLEFCWSEPLIGQAHQIAEHYGVEVRYPFLDRQLFEWALSVPPFRFGEDGRVKAPMRRALADMLPEAILNRRDKGRYGHYFDLGLRDKERPRILEFLRNPRSAELGYIEPGPLRSAYDRYCQGENVDRSQLWNWITLEEWLRQQLP